jgi:amino acid permease
MKLSLAEAYMRRSSWQQIAGNLFFSMFAASQIPFALGQMGWYFGSVLFFLIIVCSWWSGHVLTRCCIRSSAYTWPDLGTRAFGRGGAIAVNTLQTVGIVLTGMVQVQGAGAQWQQAFPDAPICARDWMLLNAAPYLLFLQIPSFGGSGLLRIASILTLCLVVWRVGLFLTLLALWGKYPYVCYGGQTFSTVLSGVVNMMFTFGVKNIMPEMAREMVKPQEMHKSWAVANAMSLPMYLLVGLWGEWAFGVFNQNAGFVLQFSHVTSVAAYNIVAAVVGYLPIVYGQICIFLKFELQFGVLPTDWFTVSNPETNKFRRIPPAVFRFVFRASVVAVYVFVAEALIGVGVGNFSSLVGAISISAFSFYLPWVLHLILLGDEMTLGQKIMYYFWVLFGVGLSLLGIYASVKTMSSIADAGLFQAPCKQNAFFMGRFSTPNGISNHDFGGYSDATGPGTFHDTIYAAACTGLHGRPANIDCAQYGACCSYNSSALMVTCH